MEIEEEHYELWANGWFEDTFETFRRAYYDSMRYDTDKVDIEIYRVITLKEKVAWAE